MLGFTYSAPTEDREQLHSPIRTQLQPVPECVDDDRSGGNGIKILNEAATSRKIISSQSIRDETNSKYELPMAACSSHGGQEVLLYPYVIASKGL